jgi:hypothetical protein
MSASSYVRPSAIGLRSEDSEATLSRGICIYYNDSSMIAIGTSGLMRKCSRLLVDMQATSQEVIIIRMCTKYKVSIATNRYQSKITIQLASYISGRPTLKNTL